MVVVPLARAQNQPAVAPAAAAPAPTPFDSWIAALKKPAPWFTWGADFRARNEYYHNAVTLAPTALNEQDVIRLRWRVSGAASATPRLAFNARVVGEARYWVNPAFVGACKGREGWENRFVFLDALALKWTSGVDFPVTVTVGRQDIYLGDTGDWWLVMDGTPNDGSWTTFFDAARVTVDAKAIDTKFDIIGLAEQARPDEWLPGLGPTGSYTLTDQDERGWLVYASNKSLPGTQVDGYFVHKHDRQHVSTVGNTTKRSGDRGDIYTAGGKITGTLTEHWRYSVEAAYQFGSKADRVSGLFRDRDIDAYGAKAKLTYALKDPLNQQLSLTGELLSGDDAGTAGTDEMFDVLWGRWPVWSELYIYSYIYETGGRIAQMNNLARLGGVWSGVPAKGTTLNFAYNALFAPEVQPTRAVVPPLFSGREHFRGHHVQAWVKRQFNKYVAGHLWAEMIWQGDYYARRERMTFLRGEISFGF